MIKTEIILNGIDVSIEELNNIAITHGCNINSDAYPILVSYDGLANMTVVYNALLAIKSREGVQTKSIFNVARQEYQPSETFISIGYND
jgi:hypothetical protein